MTDSPTDVSGDRDLPHACAELERRLRAGRPCGAVEVLCDYPDLTQNKDAVLELIYTEFVIREELGERPTPEDWCARYPEWEADLRELFQIHAHVRSGADLGASTLPTVARRLWAAGRRPRRAGDYELIEQIGRGGMGVVYKARQESLNRIVALKMITGGPHADPRLLDRFRREAEAGARLAHPNIVPVYEVGEIDGVPFIAMEYVEGGTLADELAGNPVPAARAAGLIEELARAVEYAHRRGIVHRDLKPSNVLLDRTADGRTIDERNADPGRPSGAGFRQKITDFGLVKLLAETDGPTESGAVMGTPAYMAPEQAAGNTKHVGPRADLYALGAILYECLTGQPPFAGGFGFEVIRAILTTTPVPPSRIRPGIPRDLETIALMCLEKEPARRYPTAQALAEDLRRFQDGRPILARAPGALYQFGKFARRNRAAVAAVAVVFLVLVVGLIGTLIGLDRATAARRRAEAAERESYVSAAELALQRGAWRDALKNLNKALDAGHPDEVRLRLMKVRALCAVHEVPQAVAELRDLGERPDLGERRGEVLLWQADIALAQKSDEAGLSLVHAALQHPLPPADAAFARALLAGTVQEAVAAFRRALELDPFHHRANGMVTVLFIVQGEMALAREQATFARRLFPDDPTFPILLAAVHAWEGNDAVADAELKRIRPQLSENLLAAVRSMIGLATALRRLGEQLSATIDPGGRGLAVAAFATSASDPLKTAATLRQYADPNGSEGLFFPVPPVLDAALRTVTAAMLSPGNRIDGLRRADAVCPNGFVSFALGLELGNAKRLAEAEPLFQAAVDRPSFVPIRRAALYALAGDQWMLAGQLPDPIAAAVWRARALANVRRLLAYDRLYLHEAILIVSVAYDVRDWTLIRLVVERWDRQGSEPERPLLLRLVRAEQESQSYAAAIAAADRMLVHWPGDPFATEARKRAAAGLRKQADALSPPRP